MMLSKAAIQTQAANFNHTQNFNNLNNNNQYPHRLETHYSQSQHYSQIMIGGGHGGPRSNRTQMVTPPMPPSPRAEQEMLSKLDEVGSTVNNWLKKIEENRAKLIPNKKRPSNISGLRSKSANCRTDILSSDNEEEQKEFESEDLSEGDEEDEDEEHLTVIDELK